MTGRRMPRAESVRRAPHGGGPRREEPTHLVVGRILAPWGVRGEVRAEILTQFPERFAVLQEITVGEEHRVYRLQSARLHKGNVVLKLEGVDSPEEAAGLRDELLYVPVSEAMPLEEHEYYHHQILGLDVYTTGGEYLGTVSEILETGSNDVYVVEQRGREILIPALADVVQEVDLERQRLIVTLPPGLIDEEEA